MSKRTIFNEAEIAEPADYTGVGEQAMEGDENIAGGAIGYPRHWTRLSISTISAVSLRVNPGQLFVGERVFDLDDEVTINLQARLPLVLNDRRYVAIIARGETETVNVNRLVEVDADTEETVLVAVPKTLARKVTFVVQEGLPGPSPVKPTVAADQCCLAWVLLSSTGIVSVEMNEPDRLKTLYEVDGRLRTVETSSEAAQQRTQTLETTVANVASRVERGLNPELVYQLARDAAATRRALALPDEARSYVFDAGLVDDIWDLTHGAWNARVDQGLRFPWAAQQDIRLEALDPTSASIRITGDLLLPAWTEAPRVVVEGRDGEKNLSQLVHAQVNAVRREISRKRLKAGETITVHDFDTEWAQLATVLYNFDVNARVNNRFKLGDEEFEVVGFAGGSWHPVDRPLGGVRSYTVRRYSYEEFTEVYWDYVTQDVGLNGSVYGQTWLASQPMIVTSVDFDFTRAGATGAVHLLQSATDTTAAPLVSAAIANATLQPNQISVGWTKFEHRPALVESGRRYASSLVTTGPHSIASVSGNKFSQGSLFQITDGAWAQGSASEDLALRINAAEFASVRTFVEFKPISLAGGMSEIDVIYSGWQPGGTSLTWMVAPQGQSEFQPLDARSPSPFASLPPLTRVAAVFVGTTALQPSVLLDVRARLRAYRYGTAFKAVSKDLAFGFASQVVQMESVVENFDPAANTFVQKIIVGGVEISASSTTITEDPSTPGRRRYFSVFSLGQNATTCRLVAEMTTTNVLKVPLISSIARYII